ncbi:BTAD domain-containing putative transcriptional regulator [Streptomyces sp. MUM 178J]|uniref:BTAD domain-containing putative transcriptional regulator n=1 Tax=Streptomyces sp. MUM 178J TaxID=2791991 RepID=UPI001F04F763|nr:BTAD domain-containing putative transcriptional regulator [Streptomyces sp. MUM 178J]WRQ80805.1 BTAD domain-containing putative transcriptional regulator [Streptomyces sp. MUM 178J]
MKGSSAAVLRQPDVAEIVRSARTRNGVSQRDLAERSGIGLRTLREIERGRVRAPRSGSLHRLAKALHDPVLLAQVAGMADGEGGVYQESDPLVLRILGRFSASRGEAAVAAGTPKQQWLLALLALQANAVVEREEIIEVLWGDAPPDSFGQLIHTYVSRIRLMLETHQVPGAAEMAVVRRGAAYELQVEDDGRLDLLEFSRLTGEAERAHAGNDPVAERGFLKEALRLWRGLLLEGMPTALQEHPAAVEWSRRRVAAALRFADLTPAREQCEEVLVQLGPIARHEPLHEGLHARLGTALAGSGRRAEALELFAALARRLREESGIGPGDELRGAQMAVLREDDASEDGATAARQAPAAGVRLAGLPKSAGDFVGRVEHYQVRQYLTGQGPQIAFGATLIAALYGPAGVGKSVLTTHVAASVAWRFPDGILYARMRTGKEAEVLDLLHGFLRALGVPAAELPAGVDAAASLYQVLVSGRRVLVVIDDAAGERAVRPLLPSGPGGAALLNSRAPLSGLEGARHFRVEPFTVDQSVALLKRIAGESRVLRERKAAEELALLCGGIPLAVRILGMRLAARPHWTLAQLVERLSDESRRLDELVAGDLAIRDRLRSGLADLGPDLRETLGALARGVGSVFTAYEAAAVLRRGPWDTEEELERLVDRQLLEPPAEAGDGYAFLPLVRLHAREP